MSLVLSGIFRGIFSYLLLKMNIFQHLAGNVRRTPPPPMFARRSGLCLHAAGILVRNAMAA